MDHNLPDVGIELVDKGFEQFREFGKSLTPLDNKTVWFCNLLVSLINSVLLEYHYLKIGYEKRTMVLAWACRNLLELDVFTKYVLVSEANARRFIGDRLIDGNDIFTSLRMLQLHLNPNSDVTLIDQTVAAAKTQMATEGITASKYLATSSLAKAVGMKEDYACMNRVCSKLVHPTAWSVLTMNNEGEFGRFRQIFFQSGATYGIQVYDAIEKHVDAHGAKPTP